MRRKVKKVLISSCCLCYFLFLKNGRKFIMYRAKRPVEIWASNADYKSSNWRHFTFIMFPDGGFFFNEIIMLSRRKSRDETLLPKFSFFDKMIQKTFFFFFSKRKRHSSTPFFLWRVRVEKIRVEDRADCFS